MYKSNLRKVGRRGGREGNEGERERDKREIFIVFYTETETRYEATRREIKGSRERGLNFKGKEDRDGLEGDGDHGAPGRRLVMRTTRGWDAKAKESGQWLPLYFRGGRNLGP